MSTDFRLDPRLGLVRITETAVSEEALRVELQEAADTAQNRLNAATEAVAQRVAEHTAAEEALIAARQDVADAEQEVSFSAGRIADLDEAVRLRDDLAGTSPEEENAGNSEPVEIPVTLATEATA
jgi:hypothetical protein